MMGQSTKHHNYNENHSTTPNSYYQASQNPSILTNSVGGYQCQTHHINQNSKFHNNHHHSNMQLQTHLTNNERSNNHLVVYHTATVHGLYISMFFLFYFLILLFWYLYGFTFMYSVIKKIKNVLK